MSGSSTVWCLARAVILPCLMLFSRSPAAEPLPARAAPVIILKLDDLRQSANGGVPPGWARVADFIGERKIKGSIGIIARSLEDARPSYLEWIKRHHSSGRIEFWFHGYDHRTRRDPWGKSLGEFEQRPFSQQWERFEQSQALASANLGFRFATFGPPGGGFCHQDEATGQVMAADPAMKVWLYPGPIDYRGESVAAAGKITILDRVWAVNLEGEVGRPDFPRFVRGYSKNRDRAYLVLQGHPEVWRDQDFAEFVKIIDFATAAEAVFMTPSEYATSLRQKRPADIP